MRRNAWLIVGIALLAAWLWWQQSPTGALPEPAPPTTPTGTFPGAATTERPRSDSATIPREAFDTLRLIQQGGPFPHRQDDGVFQNRERLLPRRDRGWYREYTVRTPGERDRGARRIVTGGEPASEYYYTADHYRSFQRFDPGTGQLEGEPLQ